MNSFASYFLVRWFLCTWKGTLPKKHKIWRWRQLRRRRWQRGLGGNNDFGSAEQRRLNGWQERRRWMAMICRARVVAEATTTAGKGGRWWARGESRRKGDGRRGRWRARDKCWQWWWRQARADADGQGTRAGTKATAGEDADGQGTSAGGNNNGRQGRTLTGKGREPEWQQPQVRTLPGKGQEPERRQTTTLLLGITIKLGRFYFLLGKVSFCSPLAEELFGKYSRIKKRNK